MIEFSDDEARAQIAGGVEVSLGQPLIPYREQNDSERTHRSGWGSSRSCEGASSC